MKKINFKFEFDKKKGLFASAFIFFIFLLYLSIPSLYDTGRVQKDVGKKLLEDFGLNFSLSTDIEYRMLPKPHFVIKDCELIDLDNNLSEKIAEIQSLKIFIEQKNFFNKEINIKNLEFIKANFFIKKSNFDFINKFINQKFSEKKIKVTKSKIFFNDESDDVIFIYSIRHMQNFLEIDENKNYLEIDGELFNLKNKFIWTKNFNNKNKITKFTVKKIFLNLYNEAIYKNNIYEYYNNLEIQSYDFKTNYKIKNNIVSFYSKNSKTKTNLISYEGALDLNPFNLELSITSNKLDLGDFFKNLNIFNELLTSKLLFKKNLYAAITISSDNLIKSKVFDKTNIKLNFQGGEITLDESILYSKKIGNLELNNSQFVIENNDLLFKGIFKLNVKNLNNFYKIFLPPQKHRIEFNSIDFHFELNPKSGKFKINKVFIFDEKKQVINEKKANMIITNYNEDEFSFSNQIKFKNFLHQLFIDYSEEG